MILEKYKNSSRADKNLWLVGLFILLIAVMIGSVFVVRALTDDDETDGGKKPVEFDAELGESSYLGLPIAYPVVDASKMTGISVWKVDEESGKTQLSFAMTREGMDVYKNQFVLSYTDSNGNIVDYKPEIITADSYFNYDDLYASATSDGASYSIPKLTYITSAIGVLYFDARIDYTEENKSTVLSRFGIGSDSPTIIFTAEGADGKTITHTIRIGKKLITDSAYYFTVDDRPCVYATKTNYFDYALQNFESFIHTTLISAGIESDSSYSPILTPGYKQWTNSVYKYRESDEGVREYYFVKDGDETATDPWFVQENDRIVAEAYQIIPYSEQPDKDELDALNAIFSDGYVITKSGKKIEFDLSNTKDMREAKYVLSALLGKAAGEYDSLTATVLGNFIQVEFDEELIGAQYFYTITHVESVFEDGVEKTVGTDTPNEAVKVTYIRSINGEVDEFAHHAIIPLDKNVLPDGNDEAYNTLVSAGVGELEEPIIFKNFYTAVTDTGITCNIEAVMTDIVLIYDKNGYNTDTVKNDSYVMYRYYVDYVYKLDGEEELYRFRVEGEKPAVIDMSEASEDIRKAFVGKTLNAVAGAYSTVISKSKIKCEPFMAFSSYDIKKISSAVRSELVVSFKFRDEIDHFYRESVYENTLENENGVYAINAQACEAVIYLLGGLGKNAGVSEGYKGLETVAVGITPDVMEKYGLYSKTIYFELPRLLMEKEGADKGDSDEEEEETGFVGAFDYHEKLCFTLYISEADEFGYRYVASDLYDIVAKVNASDFAFLDHSFLDLWVRRTLVLVNVTDLQRVKVNFNLDDFYGDYEFRLTHTTVDQSQKTTVFASANLAKPISDSAFLEYIKEYGVAYGENGKGEKLGNFYYDVAGKDLVSKNETVGDANFKTFLETLYSVYYEETVSPEEQAEHIDEDPIMTMRFDLLAKHGGKAYVYEFRRIDNGRVMVTFYSVADGRFSAKVSDFCISTFAFKKLAYTFRDLLNAKELDSERPYGAQ